MKFIRSKVSYPIYKNDHTNLIYLHSKTKYASLHHLMHLLSSMSEMSENISIENTENLTKMQLGVILPKFLCFGSQNDSLTPD